jgi:S1-C subfamily serine protease
MIKWLGVAAALVLSACASGYLPASFDNVADTAVFIKAENGTGSGTVIAQNLVLTAKHVAAMKAPLTIELMDGTKRTAVVLWQDDKDAAVLKVDGAPLKHAANIDCRPVEMGEPLQWIGSPLKTKFNYQRGYVSSPNSWQEEGDFKKQRPVQANFNPGDSGSGLFDMDGNLRGVVDAFVVLQATMMSVSQSGIGLMLPASEFCNSMDRLGDGISTLH